MVRAGCVFVAGLYHNFAILTLNVLYHTIPHKLFRCELKDAYGLQSFVSTHSEKRRFAFLPLFTSRNAFNLCIFKTEFSLFLTGVGLGVLECSPLPPGS